MANHTASASRVNATSFAAVSGQAMTKIKKTGASAIATTAAGS